MVGCGEKRRKQKGTERRWKTVKLLHTVLSAVSPQNIHSDAPIVATSFAQNTISQKSMTVGTCEYILNGNRNITKKTVDQYDRQRILLSNQVITKKTRSL